MDTRYLLYDVEPKKIAIASEKEEKIIRLEVFKSKNIKIDKSICEFKTISEKRVRELLKQADIRMLRWKICSKMFKRETAEKVKG